MSEKNEAPGPLHILTQEDIKRLLGVATSTVQNFRKDPTFPPRRSFGAGAKKGWLYKDIVLWLDAQPVDQEDMKAAPENLR